MIAANFRNDYRVYDVYENAADSESDSESDEQSDADLSDTDEGDVKICRPENCPR